MYAQPQHLTASFSSKIGGGSLFYPESVKSVDKSQLKSLSSAEFPMIDKHGRKLHLLNKRSQDMCGGQSFLSAIASSNGGLYETSKEHSDALNTSHHTRQNELSIDVSGTRNRKHTTEKPTRSNGGLLQIQRKILANFNHEHTKDYTNSTSFLRGQGHSFVSDKMKSGKSGKAHSLVSSSVSVEKGGSGRSALFPNKKFVTPHDPAATMQRPYGDDPYKDQWFGGSIPSPKSNARKQRMSLLEKQSRTQERHKSSLNASLDSRRRRLGNPAELSG